LECQEIVSSDPHGPGGIEVRYDTAFKFKCRIRGVVSRTLIAITLFIDSLGNMGSAETRYGLHFSKNVIQHVSPMAKHVDNNSAIIFLSVIPGWPLGRNRIAFKYPIAELSPY